MGNSTFRQQKATPLALKISKKLKKGGFFHAQKVLGGKHHTDMGQKMIYLVPEDAMASKVHITNRWTCIHMISLSQIKKFKKFVFLAENQLLRERFKVTLKEIGKEKIILKFFSTILIFSSRHVLVWW